MSTWNQNDKRIDKELRGKIKKLYNRGNSINGTCEHCGASTVDGLCELCNPTRHGDGEENLFDAEGTCGSHDSMDEAGSALERGDYDWE